MNSDITSLIMNKLVSVCSKIFSQQYIWMSEMLDIRYAIHMLIHMHYFIYLQTVYKTSVI